MITTKYNFKLWLHKKYPDITATPIYGIPAYILSKPMDNMDNFQYNLQSLKDGRYIVFIGMSVNDARDAMQKLNAGKAPVEHRLKSIAAPTTFSSFEQWLERNNIVPLNRTFCNHVSAAQALMTDDIHNCIDRNAIKTYYMYELPDVENKEELYSKVPYITTTNKNGDNIDIVLIKACNSTYKSKRQLFKEKFALMQPLYEKLISAAVRASTWDEIHGSGGDWTTVKQLCEQYMGIQFETSGTVDLVKMKEAANAGILGLWTRDRSNLESNEEDDF